MKSELFSACPDRKLSTEWKVFSLFFTRDFPLNPELTLKISYWHIAASQGFFLELPLRPSPVDSFC